MHVGEQIASAREAAGLSQEALARLAGYSTRAVASWEQGVRHPRPAALSALAAALDREVAWFYEQPGTKAAA